jgi:hypothetical protein
LVPVGTVYAGNFFKELPDRLYDELKELAKTFNPGRTFNMEQ